MTTIREALKRLLGSQAQLTQNQLAETERERRVESREPIDYSYTVFWTKTARQWDADRRAAVAANLTRLIESSDFQANPFDRKYTLDDVVGSHSGASLAALKKVLAALRDE